MTHHYPLRIRAAFVSILMAAALLLTAASVTFAQAAPCVCSTIRINVASNVGCAVTICYRVSPSGPTVCVPVQPGSSVDVPCADWQDGCIQLCGGRCYPLFDANATSKCTPTLQVGPVCCVRACREQSADERCPHIQITPVALCLGQPCN